MYNARSEAYLETAPAASGASSLVAPGGADIRGLRLGGGDFPPTHDADGLGTAIRTSSAALSDMLDRAAPVFRGAAALAWCLVALGAWLLLVLSLPLAAQMGNFR